MTLGEEGSGGRNVISDGDNKGLLIKTEPSIEIQRYSIQPNTTPLRAYDVTSTMKKNDPSNSKNKKKIKPDVLEIFAKQ